MRWWRGKPQLTWFWDLAAPDIEQWCAQCSRITSTVQYSTTVHAIFTVHRTLCSDARNIAMHCRCSWMHRSVQKCCAACYNPISATWQKSNLTCLQYQYPQTAHTQQKTKENLLFSEKRWVGEGEGWVEEGRGGERGGGGVQEEVQVAIGEVGSQFLSYAEICIHLIYSSQTKKRKKYIHFAASIYDIEFVIFIKFSFFKCPGQYHCPLCHIPVLTFWMISI